MFLLFQYLIQFPKAHIALNAKYGWLSPKMFFLFSFSYYSSQNFSLAYGWLVHTFISLPCSYLCHVTIFWSMQLERTWYLQLTGSGLHRTPLPTSQNVAVMTRAIASTLDYKIGKGHWEWQSKKMREPGSLPLWSHHIGPILPGFGQSHEKSKFISSLSYCCLAFC